MAHTAIEHAFSHHDGTDEDGDVLVNVQGGVDLVDPLMQARSRTPGSNTDSAKVVVEDISFLRSDVAVVWFSVEIDGNRLREVNGRVGRAVLEGDHWVNEHATLVDLLGFAGGRSPLRSSS